MFSSSVNHAFAHSQAARSAGNGRVPYPAISSHGVIGDRRTAALIAADGTLDWLCLPDYDGEIFFGALLDVQSGGFWKLGPEVAVLGAQIYCPDSATLETSWRINESDLRLTDTMLWPQTLRSCEHTDLRVIVRRLLCTKGRIRCVAQIQPSQNCFIHNNGYPPSDLPSPSGLHLNIWCDRSDLSGYFHRGALFELREGEEVIMVATFGSPELKWDRNAVYQQCDAADDYFRSRLARFSSDLISNEVKRTAMLIRLLTYSPTGALVAAPTTSLPERIGGDWNADYRYCWLRDTSLSLSLMAQLGDFSEAQRFMEWLSTLESKSDIPLQVLYGIRGEHDTPQHECKSFTGYRGSTPVRIGNHAFKQFQLDAFGYFAICVYDYLKCGGPWRQEFWTLAKDVANFVTANWHRESNGIWELPKRKHFLSGRVMSWAALDRVVKLSQILGKHENIARWQQTMDVIHADVMSRGWSDRLQSFRQHYDHDSLDAAALLIPLVGFLPPEHPRVISTVERIAERLTINGFVYRFDPQEMQIDIFEGDQNPMGEFEGAFVPCTFWLATAYAKMGRLKEATGIVSAVEEIAGTTGLLAEGIDPRQNTFSGNFPLLFSHAEHLRTIKEIEYANRR